MSTEMTYETDTKSYEDTVSLASKIGKNLRGGEVIELIADLGGGKTAFVTGLAQGMGSADPVSSPSFTINQIYKAGRLELNHYDLYRLHEPGIMREEIREAVNDPDVVLAIEWGESASDVLPADRATIQISPIDENSRHITINVPSNYKHLIKDLT